MYQKLGLIGCGLMGGSFALAMRRAGLVRQITGYSPSQSTLDKALNLGVIDEQAMQAADAARDADLILVAVPVAATESVLAAIAPALSPKVLVMDVGSTKCDVVAAARAALKDRISCFVPAHPIAGKERAGIEQADAGLYQDRLLILTPSGDTALAKSREATKLWEALGSQVMSLTPEQHDTIFAAVSHLPHLLAFAFMRSVVQQPMGQRFLELAGPGFRDFTRIAASDPKVWRDILLANREEVLRQCLMFQDELRGLSTLIASGDAQAIEQAIATASAARADWQMNQN